MDTYHDKGGRATKGPQKDHGDAADSGPEHSEFVAAVRDALLHLYDTSYLQTHSLAQRLGVEKLAEPGLRSGRLFRMLLAAVEALRPALGTPSESRAWRIYRLLELRYLESHSADTTMSELAISSTQYKRDHARALEAVASVLQEHLSTGENSVDAASGSRQALAVAEAEELASHASGDPIDLAATLADLVDLIRPAAERAGSTIRLDAPPSLAAIRADRVLLRQAFLGLLGMALGAGAGGSVDVTVAASRQAVAVRITALPGAEGGGERVSQGNVEVARRLVDLVGGTLSLSAPDDGWWMACVDLPIAPRLLVLVVDNDDDFVGLVARYLASEGTEVVGAPDVQTAEEIAVERSPDVILLDVMLPGRDGWDCLLTLRSREETRGIPVIVCSVLYEPQVAKALGVAGYLPKPVSRAELLGALRPFRSRMAAAPIDG